MAEGSKSSARFKPYQDYLRACKRAGIMPRTFDWMRRSCPSGVGLESYVRIKTALAENGQRD